MKLTAEMYGRNKEYGGYRSLKYKVKIRKSDNDIELIFTYLDAGTRQLTQKGGSIWMPRAVANKIGHGLVLTSMDDEMELKAGIEFSVNEERLEIK